MKKLWKYLKMLPVIVYPYLYMVAILVVFIVGVIEDNSTQSYDYTMLAMVISIIMSFVITGLCFIISTFNSIRSGNNAYGLLFPVKINFLIKLIQIPAYIINFIFGIIGILMSIWGIGIVALMLVVDLLTILISGINNIGACINLYKNKVLSKEECIIFALLSFIYIVDVGVAIYLFILLKRKRKNILT